MDTGKKEQPIKRTKEQSKDVRNRGEHCPHSENGKCFNKRKSSTVSNTAGRLSIV